MMERLFVNRAEKQYMRIHHGRLHAEVTALMKRASSKLPILSTTACKYLCVCATSSPSERVFSCSGNIVTPTRSSMNPQKVDMLSKNLQ